jgi:hypothetical protein
VDLRELPKDGTRVLLHFYVQHYINGEYKRHGTKWEECWFVDGGWQPWCGNERYRTTASIAEEDIIEYELGW